MSPIGDVRCCTGTAEWHWHPGGVSFLAKCAACVGLRALAVAYEDVPSGDADGPGSGFQLIGILSIFDPPRDDTKQTIDDAVSLGLKVKMVTGDQLAIAK
ncbi:hypothetical protein PtA15_3A77 [Puccinia triticina]|uniref:Cation-transporting P-type ATPase C-terminal domain-containing protein n=1 Tax=Puccinia triticina TaxID=208348 RepID=A0ABY7CCR9_9BASI|nr:uncharacterized protein PtA15_3A77 [Puccinia triticina]WAQ82713.1 hypothetical protein PtA15_3A77 [Puccinia triticina]